ncbi:S-methyl-5-thioribose-1-phosphate isomerase [Enterococcus rivorum]|uniref:S-methyl-5-thioribose-1-phosphate isomerase n=1 Tax=Enterococcus rivorum TaxID=762845 RepID=UPI000A6DC993|nr:S-methyl-5-thioribose-1-phosphate isomerase [Enterococcus rivorum]MBP2100391.1 methylthioribose-1-phosphate isomerase [Enterococcus rivorum]
MFQVTPVTFNGKEVIILDQTKLPTEEVYLKIDNLEDLWEAIVQLRVRGAPAIGIAAGFGAALGANQIEAVDYTDFSEQFFKVTSYLATSRPTAVNLFWALNRMEKLVKENQSASVSDLKALIEKEAHDILQDDIKICKQLGENGLTLFEDGMTILTHCNAGVLATSEYGTALSPIYLGQERGIHLKVYADETRPLLQGSRLTSWELSKAGIDVTLITDNMAAMVMGQGKIDAVIVGCDRVAANGDVANKIGTYGVAILAKEHNIPFYVSCPTSTIDVETATGAEIPIEERGAEEIICGFGNQTAPSKVKTYNPAFDVTPNHLITAIITEKGVLKGNYQEEIAKLF